MAARPLPLRGLRHGEIAVDGRATHLNPPRHGGNPHLLGVQPLHLILQVDPPFVALLAGCGVGGTRRRGWLARRWRGRRAKGFQDVPVTEQEPFQRITQMVHQVKAVDDLHGLRRTVPNALGRQATAVAADDLDTRMRLQPLGDGRRGAIGEQIDHPMAFEITHHGSAALAPPPRPFIKPDDPWGCLRREGRTMDEAQNCPATSRHAQRTGKWGTSPAAQREADGAQGGVDARAVTTTVRGKCREALGQNAPRTGPIPAEEAADPHMQEDRRPTNRQVDDRAQGGTMDSCRAVLTARTRADRVAELSVRDVTRHRSDSVPPGGKG